MLEVKEKTDSFDSRRETVIRAGNEIWVIRSEANLLGGLKAFRVKGPEFFVPPKLPADHEELVNQVLALILKRRHQPQDQTPDLARVPTDELVRELAKRGRVAS